MPGFMTSPYAMEAGQSNCAFDPISIYLKPSSQHSITSAYPRTKENGCPFLSVESNTSPLDLNLPV